MRRLLALPTAALLLVATAACGGGGSDSKKAAAKPTPDTSISGLSVKGDVGSAPDLTIKKAVSVTKAETEVVSKGTGDPVKLGGQALLNLVIAKGKTGEKAVSTYDQGKPLSASMVDGQFFPALLKVLPGTPTGSRVAFADTVSDLYGSAGASQIGMKPSDTLVFVIDVMSVSPTKLLKSPEGKKSALPSGAPAIEGTGTKLTKLDFAKAAKTPPKKLTVIPLVTGTGPAIKGPKIVTMNYLGQVYGRAKPFNNSYTSQPATFDVDTGSLIPGWDKALQGQRVGSRIMLIVPPSEGYGKKGNPDIKVTGKSTLVFVMDILGVG